ncbi:hypothetical protein [Bacillus mycoides]|uniref:hypothetical protein n=1 Tax=Bacillus mycoides TaxID=1405 RepID=UPI003D6492FB
MKLLVKKNGKYKSINLSRKFYKNKPKTKRLRKKKFWLFCADCKKWFNKWEGGAYATRNDGGKVCNKCLVSRVERNLAEREKTKTKN